MAEMKTNRVVVADNKRISVFAFLLRGAYKAVGAKKAFSLPEDEIRKVIEKQNRSHGTLLPSFREKCRETMPRRHGCRR